MALALDSASPRSLHTTAWASPPLRVICMATHLVGAFFFGAALLGVAFFLVAVFLAGALLAWAFLLAGFLLQERTSSMSQADSSQSSSWVKRLSTDSPCQGEKKTLSGAAALPWG